MLATLLVAGAAVGQTVCPSTRLSLSGGEITLSVAQFDSTYLLNRLHFDLVPGTLGLAYCCSLYPSYMYVRDALIELPITITAGTPLTLEFEFWARRSPGGDHGADATGIVRFVGVPPGARVISCQGDAGIATPVHGASWGRLKTLYR